MASIPPNATTLAQRTRNTPILAFSGLPGELFTEMPLEALCWAAFISDQTGNRFAGPATAHHRRMGMKRALPEECLVEMQNPHRWIAPRGAAARPKGLEPPTF